ncbi:Simvastatin synthase [Biscogniauxia marginata]|nr:Simvastatin synthase [Biscogniauxia marginata]
MEQVDKLFQEAISDGRIHGAVLLAKDLTVNVSRCYGVRSVREEAPEKRPPMTVDTPMRFASMFKLVTSIMVLHIEELLPEGAAFKVLTGFDDVGKPVERDPKSPILLRHLLSHSSGIAYTLTFPLLHRYREHQGLEIDQGYDTLDQNFGYPLLFDPGTDFAYGPGIDWAARLVQRASGVPTEEFLQQHIATPLGISADDMTFELQKHPSTQIRRGDTTVRDAETGRLRYQDEEYWHSDPRDAHGGQGIFTTPGAYIKVLWSILSDDGKLLRPETRRLLFEPMLTPRAEDGLAAYCEKFRKSHSVGGLVTLDDCDGDHWRRKGNLSWSGFPNIVWNIDQEVGLCSLWAFHLKPFGDPICNGLGRKFEEALYAILRK